MKQQQQQNQELQHKETPLKRINFIIMGIAALLIIVGFALMLGSATEHEFNPDIFSWRRITLAPMVALIGFILMIIGILYKKK